MASTKTGPAASQIKSSRARRTRYTDQYKAEVVAAFESSGLSGPAFARQRRIKASTFAAWVAKARRQASSRQAARSSSAFIIAEIGEQSAAGGETLEVRLPGGATALAGTSRQVVLLAELLKSLV